MPDILGLHGQNFSSGTEELIAVWRRAPMIYRAGSWEKAPITLTTDQKAEFASFLDCAFMVNGIDPLYCYDETNWYRGYINTSDSPIGKIIRPYNVKLYLGGVTIAGTAYPSRVWPSDLPKNDQITWGLEMGDDLVQTADSAVVTSVGSVFIERNIKVGDPFLITSGVNAGEYIVQSIDSETQITLTANLDTAAIGSSFWVGGNYFDVRTDDGDTLQAFGENSNELLFFKKNSLHRYNSRGQELRRVKAAPGTTSQRGVVNVGSYTYYYHPSGIYRVGLPTVELISNPIYDFIEGVTAANQSEVVAWKEDEKKAVFFLGDVTLRDGRSITNCAVAFDTTSETWQPRSYPIDIRAAANWLEDDVPSVYVGDDSDTVFEMNTGYHFNDDPIPFEVEDKPQFAVDEDTLVDFTRVRTYINNGPEVQLLFKLYYKPTRDKDRWLIDKEWQPLKGSQRGDKQEWLFPDGSRACGVAIKAIESSTHETFLLEKYVIYHANPAIV